MYKEHTRYKYIEILTRYMHFKVHKILKLLFCALFLFMIFLLMQYTLWMHQKATPRTNKATSCTIDQYEIPLPRSQPISVRDVSIKKMHCTLRMKNDWCRALYLILLDSPAQRIETFAMTLLKRRVRWHWSIDQNICGGLFFSRADATATRKPAFNSRLVAVVPSRCS